MMNSTFDTLNSAKLPRESGVRNIERFPIVRAKTVSATSCLNGGYH